MKIFQIAVSDRTVSFRLTHLLSRLFLVVLLGLGLSSCVTETSGGFNVEPSEDGALQNYLRLSMGYLDQGDLTSARRHLNNAMDIDPNNAVAHSIWALLYTVEGDTDLADQSFRRAIREDGDNAQIRNNYAAFLFSNERYQEAYEQLEQVVQDPNYMARPQAFENLGFSALRLGRTEDAEYAFRRAIQLNSNLFRSSLELAEIELGKNNHRQAQNYYNSYQATRQFLNLEESARSLWIGYRIEKGLGNNTQAARYALSLAEYFADSDEFAQYQSSIQ